MKRIVTWLVLLLLAFVPKAALMAQQHFSVESSTYQELRIAFSAGQLDHQSVSVDGVRYTRFAVDGAIPSQQVGCPELPVFSHLIEVPMMLGTFSVEVSNVVTETLSLSDLGIRDLVMPAQPSRSKSDTTALAFQMDHATYTTDAYYSLFGSTTCSVTEVGVARDRRLALLQIAPVAYNPVSGMIQVVKSMDVHITFTDVDENESERLYALHHTPFFGGEISTLNHLPHKDVSSSAPVRYLVVCHSSFTGQLDSLLVWKRRKGFLADIVYTNNPSVGNTTASIASYLQSLYMGATPENPAPTYVLLVGDVEQIPAFDGTTASDHISDLYYYTWTAGDNIPDCYFGRFSAQTTAQLTPQVNKTLMYERYTFADPSFLDRAVLVAGVDGGNSGDYGYTHADPAMDYASIHYVNGTQGFSQVRYFKNNTAIDPGASNVTVGSSASSNSATVRSYYNQGAGWINYSAHGSATSWGTPNFTTSHVASMTNVQKFGVMIGNCCLTQKFETPACLGEALLRKDNYCGAVAYIGGTNSTYWSEDFYWAVGLRSGIGPTMSLAYDASHLGVYDRLCHTHNESYANRYFTNGAMVMAGNMAVQSSTSGKKLYYWEIYLLMGDPSVMPWLTQADTMNTIVPSAVLAGSPTPISVHAVPYAYVAVKDPQGNLVAASFADAQGDVTITPNQAWQIGTYEVAATAQQYRTSFRRFPVIAPDGPFVSVASLQESAPFYVGDTVLLFPELANQGTQPAGSIRLAITTDCNGVQLLDSVSLCGPLANGQSSLATQPFRIKVKENTADLTRINFTVSASWDTSAFQSQYMTAREIYAPKFDVAWDLTTGPLAPGQSGSLHFLLQNNGHMAFQSGSLNIVNPYPMAVDLAVPETVLSIPVNGVFERTYTIHTAADVPEGLAVPVSTVLANAVFSHTDHTEIHLGTEAYEDFDGIVSLSSDWTNDATSPWTLANDDTHSGTHSLRSGTITHSQSSTITIQWTGSRDDSVGFWYKVSSENNYDWLRFSIDGTEIDHWSGTSAGWSYFSYPVAQGTHTFQFAYTKDVSVSSGSDCAWIDDLRLPIHSASMTAHLDTVCPGSDYVFQGAVVNTMQPGSDYVIVPIDDYHYQYQAYQIAPVHQLDTLVVATCDSYVWNNHQYTLSGLYEQSSTDSYGCDSITYLQLTLNYRTKDTIEVNAINSYEFAGQILTQSGRYQHTFTSEEGCDSVVVLILDVQYVGIESAASSSLVVYPNPARDHVTLQCQTPIEEVYVYDLMGRQVSAARPADGRISLIGLPSGTYLLKVFDANRQIHLVRLVVKE